MSSQEESSDVWQSAQTVTKCENEKHGKCLLNKSSTTSVLLSCSENNLICQQSDQKQNFRSSVTCWCRVVKENKRNREWSRKNLRNWSPKWPNNKFKPETSSTFPQHWRHWGNPWIGYLDRNLIFVTTTRNHCNNACHTALLRSQCA